MVGEHESRDTLKGKKSRVRTENEPRVGAGLWCQVLSELHWAERQ